MTSIEKLRIAIGPGVREDLLLRAIKVAGNNFDVALDTYLALARSQLAAPSATSSAPRAQPQVRQAKVRQQHLSAASFALQSAANAPAPPQAVRKTTTAISVGAPSVRPTSSAALPPRSKRLLPEAAFERVSGPGDDDDVVLVDDDNDAVSIVGAQQPSSTTFNDVWPKALPSFQTEVSLTSVVSGSILGRAIVLWLERAVASTVVTGGATTASKSTTNDATGVVRLGLAPADASVERTPFCVAASGNIVVTPLGCSPAIVGQKHQRPPSAIGRLARDLGHCLAPLLSAGLVHVDGLIVNAQLPLRIGSTIGILVTVHVHGGAARLLTPTPSAALPAAEGTEPGNRRAQPPPGVTSASSAATKVDALIAAVGARLSQAGALRLSGQDASSASPAVMPHFARDLLYCGALFDTAYLAAHGCVPPRPSQDAVVSSLRSGGDGSSTATAPAERAAGSTNNLPMSKAPMPTAASAQCVDEAQNLPSAAAAADNDEEQESSVDNAAERVDDRALSILLPGATYGEPAPRLPLAPQPPSLLNVSLRPYQRAALSWMLSREVGGPPVGDDPSTSSRSGLTRDQSSRIIGADGAIDAAVQVDADDASNGAAAGANDVLLRLVTSPARGSAERENDIVPPATAFAVPARSFSAATSKPAVATQSFDASERAASPSVVEPSPWETIAFGDGTPLYLNAFARHVQLAPPVRAPLACVGGILADEMGLGKTVETLALIAATRDLSPAHGKSSDADVGGTKPPPVRATLVVCPLTLVGQWEAEVTRFVGSGGRKMRPFTTFVHYGTRRAASVAAFTRADVVVTSYGTLAAELDGAISIVTRALGGTQGSISIASGVKRQRMSAASVPPLFSVTWARVVLDEAHTIRNRSTRIARACCSLSAHARWALTGTPLQNSLLDVFSLLSFLQHPFGSVSVWRDAISVPFARGDPRGLAALREVLGPIILRRTKSMRDCDGQMIGDLPPPVITTVRVTLSLQERAFYDALYGRSKAAFDQLLATGRIKAHFAAILTLLLHLRQACDSPALVSANPGMGNDSNLGVGVQGDLIVSQLKATEGSSAMVEASSGISNRDDDAIVLDDDDDDSSTTAIPAVPARPRKIIANHSSKISALVDEIDQIASYNKRIRAALDATAAANDFATDRQAGMSKVLGGAGFTRAARIVNAIANDEETTRLRSDCDTDVVELLSDGVSPVRPTRRLSRRLRTSVPLSPPSDYEAEPQEHVHGQVPDCRAATVRPIPNDIAFVGCLSESGSEVHHGSDNSFDGSVVVSRKPSDRVTAVSTANDYGDALRSDTADGLVASQGVDVVYASTTEVAALPPQADSQETVAGMQLRGIVKVVVFSCFTGALDLIGTALHARRVPFTRLDGTMSNSARDAAVRAFTTRRDMLVFLVSLTAGGTGLNLTCASVAYLVEPNWNPAAEAQALSRLHRLGQR